MKEKLTEKQERLWRMGAAAAPLIQVSGRAGWAAAAGAVGIALVLQKLPAGRETPEGRVRKVLREGLILLAMVEAMRHMGSFWEPGERWMPVIFLVLAAWGAGKGREQTAYYSIVLTWLVGILLGTSLLSAVPEIRWENLHPEGEPGGLLPVLEILLLTGMKKKDGERETPYRGTGLLAVAAAVCVQGALSWDILREERDPFYEISRSVRFLGGMKRFESLTILGMMLGGFLWLSYLIYAGSGSEEKKNIWWMAAIAGLLYWAGVTVPEWLIPIGIIVLNYVVPRKGKSRKVKD